MEVLGFSLTATKRETEQGRDSPVLDVYFPHALYARWFRQDGRSSTLEHAAHLALGSHLTVRYHDAPREIPEAENTAEDPSGTAPDALSPLPSDMSPPDREEYGFDNFFSGQKNELAVSIIRSMLEDLKCGSMPYNPLLLRGLPGTGKTHLLKAAAAALRHIPALAEQGRIYTLSAPDFAGLFRQSPARQEIVRGMLRRLLRPVSRRHASSCPISPGAGRTHFPDRHSDSDKQTGTLRMHLPFPPAEGGTGRSGRGGHPLGRTACPLSPVPPAQRHGAGAGGSRSGCAPELCTPSSQGTPSEYGQGNSAVSGPPAAGRSGICTASYCGCMPFSVIPATCRMSRIWKDSSALRVHATA